jgi:pimeloyl-[acyl-carrier protein] methyl ester esterase
MHSGIWKYLSEHLAKSYRVVSIDLPGHGHSAIVDPYTLAQITKAISASVEDEPCLWVGWSLGATVVLEMAKCYPQQVQALTLLAGNPHFLSSEDWLGMDAFVFEKFRESLKLQGNAALLKFLLLQLSALPNAKVELSFLKQVLEECAMPEAVALSGGLQILSNQDLRPVLETINVPLQIILGSDDKLVPVAAGDAMLALQPTAQLHVIEQAGHVPFISHPQQVISCIEGFYNRIL